MILAIDFVAQRYGMLPSQLLEHGTSLDVVVAQQAQEFTNRKQAEARDGGRSSQKNVPQPSEAEMMDMLKKVKERAK